MGPFPVHEHMQMMELLVVADVTWVPVCLHLVAAFSATVRPCAVAHLVGDGA